MLSHSLSGHSLHSRRIPSKHAFTPSSARIAIDSYRHMGGGHSVYSPCMSLNASMDPECGYIADADGER